MADPQTGNMRWDPSAADWAIFLGKNEERESAAKQKFADVYGEANHPDNLSEQDDLYGAWQDILINIRWPTLRNIKDSPISHGYFSELSDYLSTNNITTLDAMRRDTIALGIHTQLIKHVGLSGAGPGQLGQDIKDSMVLGELDRAGLTEDEFNNLSDLEGWRNKRGPNGEKLWQPWMEKAVRDLPVDNSSISQYVGSAKPQAGGLGPVNLNKLKFIVEQFLTPDPEKPYRPLPDGWAHRIIDGGKWKVWDPQMAGGQGGYVSMGDAPTTKYEVPDGTNVHTGNKWSEDGYRMDRGGGKDVIKIWDTERGGWVIESIKDTAITGGPKIHTFETQGKKFMLVQTPEGYSTLKDVTPAPGEQDAPQTMTVGDWDFQYSPGADGKMRWINLGRTGEKHTEPPKGQLGNPLWYSEETGADGRVVTMKWDPATASYSIPVSGEERGRKPLPIGEPRVKINPYGTGKNYSWSEIDGDWTVDEGASAAAAAPTMESMVTQAIIDGDWERAAQLDDFRKRPSAKERMDMALQYARSPADYMTVLGMMRGELPIQAEPGAFQRIGPVSQMFDAMGRPQEGVFGRGFGFPTDTGEATEVIQTTDAGTGVTTGDGTGGTTASHLATEQAKEAARIAEEQAKAAAEAARIAKEQAAEAERQRDADAYESGLGISDEEKIRQQMEGLTPYKEEVPYRITSMESDNGASVTDDTVTSTPTDEYVIDDQGNVRLNPNVGPLGYSTGRDPGTRPTDNIDVRGFVPTRKTQHGGFFASRPESAFVRTQPEQDMETFMASRESLRPFAEGPPPPQPNYGEMPTDNIYVAGPVATQVGDPDRPFGFKPYQPGFGRPRDNVNVAGPVATKVSNQFDESPVGPDDSRFLRDQQKNPTLAYDQWEEKWYEKRNKKANSTTVPGLAKGTDSFGGGSAVVGEKGPELVTLPKGSKVKPWPSFLPSYIRDLGREGKVFKRNLSYPSLGALRFPSAQAWGRMTPVQQKFYQTAVELQGVPWEDYSQQMQKTSFFGKSPGRRATMQPRQVFSRSAGRRPAY